MKFLYQYRTRDNVKRTGEVNAATREAAFAALKAQGIRPERVVDAPGFLNKLFGRGKRWLAIAVLGAGCAVLIALLVARRPPPVALDSSLDDPSRRQIIGDSMVIEMGIRTGWATVFDDEGERFLASFAIPGVPAGQRSTTEDALREALARDCRKEGASTADHRSPLASDSLEARQMRAMVEGMKDELRAFMAAGGSIRAYGRKLVARQEEELAERNRVVNELATAKRAGMSGEELEALWEKLNGDLRQMGIKLVPLSE